MSNQRSQINFLCLNKVSCEYTSEQKISERRVADLQGLGVIPRVGGWFRGAILMHKKAKNKNVMLIFIVSITSTFKQTKKTVAHRYMPEIACISFDAFFRIIWAKRTPCLHNIFLICLFCMPCWYIIYTDFVEFCDAINNKGVKWKSENKFMLLTTKNPIFFFFPFAIKWYHYAEPTIFFSFFPSGIFRKR